MLRIIGVGIGGLVTYVLLIIMVGTQYSDTYLTAIVIGAIVTLAWPWFIGLMLARRVKDLRDDQIQKEVDARMKAKVD